MVSSETISVHKKGLLFYIIYTLNIQEFYYNWLAVARDGNFVFSDNCSADAVFVYK